MLVSSNGHEQTVNNPVRRQPLGQLSSNAKLSPQKPGEAGKKTMSRSPLKRSVVSILDDDSGFQYLKRRKMSGGVPFSGKQAQLGFARQTVHDDGRVRSETARFRSIPGQISRTRTVVRNADVSEPIDASTLVQARPNAEQEQGSSTEPNTPSEDSARESHHSFTSFINYDPSSQHLLQGPFPHSNVSIQSASRSYAQRGGAIRSVRSSQAEILRLRLKVAMYKVKTNQIYTPFSRLHVNRPARLVATRAPIGAAFSPASSSSDEPELPQRLRTSASRKRKARAKHATPNVYPTPSLLPMSRPARMVFGPPLPTATAHSAGVTVLEQEDSYAGAGRRASTVDPARVRYSSETTIVHADQSPVVEYPEVQRRVSLTPRAGGMVI